MEIETITKIAYLALTALNILLVVVCFFAWLLKRSKAKTPEEKSQADEIMKTNLSVAMANIKSNLNELNLRFTTKAIKQAFKQTLKEEKK